MGKHISSMSTSMVGEILMKSPLGCVLKHWEDIRGDPVTRKKKNGSNILQLMLSCRREGK